jgi:hypothetical protein
MLHHALHRIVAGLVRRTWIVAVVTVIVCAVCAAHATAALVEASYLGPASRGAAPLTPRAPVVAKPRTPPDGTALVARNMFCSSCADAIDAPRSTDDFVPDAILIATSIGDEPRATVRVPRTEVQGSWGIGDVIPGVGTIETIGWSEIEVRDDAGRRGRLSLREATGRGDPGAATPAAAAAASPWASRLRKIDDHTFEVDRDLVRDLVSGATKPGAVRISPVMDPNDAGVLKGLRLYGVGPTTLFAAIGIKNADVLVAVNNTQIKSAQTLIDLYAQLDQLNTVELGGTRGDKPLTITLRLR